MKQAQSIYLTTNTVYNTSLRLKLKFTQEAEESIDKLLSINEDTKFQGLRKQMMKKKIFLRNSTFRVFQLVTQLYVITSVVKNLNLPKEALICQSYSPGFVYEFDWGEIKFHLGDISVRL